MAKRKSRPKTPGQFIAAVDALILSAGRRVAESDPPDLPALVALADTVQDAIRTAVAGQRSSGITWEWIAKETGTSIPAAIQKWGRYCQPGSRYLVGLPGGPVEVVRADEIGAYVALEPVSTE